MPSAVKYHNTLDWAGARASRRRAVRNANLIGITVFDKKPEEAATIAKEIARVLQEHHHQVEAAGSGANGFGLEVIDRATPAFRPVRLNKPFNIALGVSGGLVFGAAAGAGRRHLQARQRTQTG